MNYSKIQLRDGGLKGAEIWHWELNEKGLPFPQKIYPPSAVHLALQKKFKELKKHLVTIGGQVNADTKDDIAKNIAEGAIVHTIEFEGDSIFLTGIWERFTGKFLKISTFAIQESDEYIYWDELLEIAESIKEETTAYINGTVKVSDAETIAMWAVANKKESEFTMDKILAMPPDELVKFSTLVLEKGKGAVVMFSNEIGEDNNEEIEQIKTEFALSHDQPIELGEAKQPKTKKVKEVAETKEDPAF